MIDPEKLYSRADLIKNNFFPWCNDTGTTYKLHKYQREIIKDRLGDNILKALPKMSANGTKIVSYIIKGENLINFIKLYEIQTAHSKNKGKRVCLSERPSG